MNTVRKQLKIVDCFKQIQSTKRLPSQTMEVIASTGNDEVHPVKRSRNSESNLEVDSTMIVSCSSHLKDIPQSQSIENGCNRNKVGDEEKENRGTDSRLLCDLLTEPGWRNVLQPALSKPYIFKITEFLEQQYRLKRKIFPPYEFIFNAFNLTPFDRIKVVLIGQDPYHNEGQAHGLCFSVPHGIPPPPSLKNIYKELKAEFSDFRVPTHGCLEAWADQGVFMLNATLTVEAYKANSHSAIGWQMFTDAVIRVVSERAPLPCVFLLWGGFAQKKAAFIDAKRHRIIKAAHPSPLSYHKFRGSACFGQTNKALIELKREPINWNCL